jgi:hypothetical protein
VVFDEDAKEAEYVEALMEGDSKKAGAIRKEINKHLREEAEAAAATVYEKRQQASAQEIAARDLASAADQASKDYPYLDTDDGAEALQLILASRDRRAAQGVPLAKALSDAVALIAPKFAPAGQGPAAAEDKKEPAADDKRPSAALARGAADSIKQPPAAAAAGIGNRASGTTIDVEGLTDDQFKALPEAEKKRLRGDGG